MPKKTELPQSLRGILSPERLACRRVLDEFERRIYLAATTVLDLEADDPIGATVTILDVSDVEWDAAAAVPGWLSLRSAELLEQGLDLVVTTNSRDEPCLRVSPIASASIGS